MKLRYLLSLLALAATQSVPSAGGSTDKYRVIWNRAPESSATIGWCQKDGDNPQVHYGEAGTFEGDAFPQAQAVDHQTSHHDLDSRFVRLTGLKPDSAYQFVVRDSNSQSPRFWFKTAPAGEAEFSFVAGGDSRNHRDARQRANQSVAKLKPLFVCFGGDMINSSTPKEWAEWLDDWQLTTGEDGRMYPIIAARGNHEGAKDVHAFFDTPNAGDYYAVDFGNGYVRVYTLNTNVVRAGSQGKWLARDLAANASAKWKIAHYHHPFRPHQSGKKEQHAQYNAWAPLFFKHGLDLAIECDSHVVKRTWPLRPSNEPGSQQGFIRDDSFGTTFIGEGCWGAPLRRNDDDKKWTRASGSFNQVNWICVTPQKIFTRTIVVDSVADAGSASDSNPFALPEGMQIWEPDSGAVVTILPKGEDGSRPLDLASLARVEIIPLEQDFEETTRVRIEIKGEPGEGAEIRYTLDGRPLSSGANRYESPFEIEATTTLTAAIFRDGAAATEPVSLTVKKKDPPPLKRYLYMSTPDGAQREGASYPGIVVFDIDDGHKFVKRIDIEAFADGMRGFTGSTATGKLYYSTTKGRLGCFDPETELVDWESKFDMGCDRSCITADGKRIYAPTGWWWRTPESGFIVVDAADGKKIDHIAVGPRAHNSIASLDGEFVFLGTEVTLTKFRASDGHPVQTITPVGESGVFPYCVDSKNRWAFVCLGKHVGFDVVDLNEGSVPHRVFATDPESGEKIEHRTHGAGMTPDEKELWISDQKGKKLFIFDITKRPPGPKGHVELSMGGHGWVTFSLDGKFAYCHTPDVFDVATKKKVASLTLADGQPFASSKFIEVHMRGDKVVRVGNEFGLGRVGLE